MQYIISDPKSISARAFDDEVVIANFTTGVYYSLVGHAAEIWNGLSAGLSIERIIDLLPALPQTQKDSLIAQAREFISELENEGLIRSGSAEMNSLWRPQNLAEAVWPPKFEKFTDMQDLLLLDPVHDVTDAGWPHENPEKRD